MFVQGARSCLVAAALREVRGNSSERWELGAPGFHSTCGFSVASPSLAFAVCRWEPCSWLLQRGFGDSKKLMCVMRLESGKAGKL